MAASRLISHTNRRKFNRIMAQLDKTKSDPKILKIIAQAATFLREHDVDWSCVGVRILESFVPLSQRTKAAKTPAAAAPPLAMLGADRRVLLKKAIARHPNWDTVRDNLGVTTLSELKVEDLVAIAQLLGIDDSFLKLFSTQ